MASHMKSDFGNTLDVDNIFLLYMNEFCQEFEGAEMDPKPQT